LDYGALAFATWGVGYFPLAPGTFGSAVGVVIFLLLKWWVAQVVAIILITGLGIWAASRTERVLALKDPGIVVVDEVAGQMIALLPVSLFRLDAIWIIVLFVLFRAFDIIKPYPARRCESLPGGVGIVTDDLVAGIYAGLVVLVIILLRGA
jgi:phosphatidylglycerophosphatase A